MKHRRRNICPNLQQESILLLSVLLNRPGISPQLFCCCFSNLIQSFSTNTSLVACTLDKSLPNPKNSVVDSWQVYSPPSLPLIIFVDSFIHSFLLCLVLVGVMQHQYRVERHSVLMANILF